MTYSGVDVNVEVIVEIVFGVSLKKIKIDQQFDPLKLLLSMYLKTLQDYYRNTCSTMLISSLFKNFRKHSGVGGSCI